MLRDGGGGKSPVIQKEVQTINSRKKKRVCAAHRANEEQKGEDHQKRENTSEIFKVERNRLPGGRSWGKSPPQLVGDQVKKEKVKRRKKMRKKKEDGRAKPSRGARMESGISTRREENKRHGRKTLKEGKCPHNGNMSMWGVLEDIKGEKKN